MPLNPVREGWTGPDFKFWPGVYLSFVGGFGFSRWENFQINTRIARINGNSLIITLSFPFQIFEKMFIVVFIISFSRLKTKKVPTITFTSASIFAKLFVLFKSQENGTKTT